MALLEMLIPTATFVLGFGAKAGTDWLQDRRAAQRDQQARRENHYAQNAQRQADFQRATLIELQEVLAKLMRTTFQSHHADVMAHRSGAPWKKQLLPEDVNLAHAAAAQRSHLLIARASDDEVRSLVQETKNACGRVIVAPNEAAGDAAFKQANEHFEAANVRIGAMLRALDLVSL